MEQKIMSNKLRVGSDFSGVGAFNQALMRLGVTYEEIFACDMDKYARQTFIANYGEPQYYPVNVYDRVIPEESLDIYMTSPPCQAFSLAGKRLGKDDQRGILFFNSLEFIQKNQPRYFIFENVKGLLSDDGGKTFSEWVNLLGGKSVNGNSVMFPYEESVPYHLYWKVLNAKDHGVPQNRERVFLIGIRDDADNTFRFPAEENLTKRLKDVLEEDVDDKYFLSEKMLELLTYNGKEKGVIGNLNKGGQKGEVFSEKSNHISCLSATDYKQPKQIQIKTEKQKSNDLEEDDIKTGAWRTHKSGNGFTEIASGNCPTIPAREREDGSGQPVIAIKSATTKGFEEATSGDSVNYAIPSSETRRGTVGKQVAQTLDTGCQQGVCIPVLTPNRIEKRQNGRRFKENGDPAFTVTCQDQHGIYDGYSIRRLTPRECFRLMDFPDSFIWPVSDSQAYKQAGNSIVVNVLYKIIKNLRLLTP